MCFVQTGARIVGISAAHVHDEILRLKALYGGAHCQVGAHVFEPAKRIIDIDRHLDLVTYDFSEVSTNAAGANVNSPLSWPPLAADRDTILACGWPSELWTAGNESHNFELLHFIALLQQNNPSQVGVVTFTSSSIPWGERALPAGTNLGGMSGGPVFRLIEQPLTRLELVGIIYEYQPTFELILARPLTLVGRDGFIIHSDAPVA